MFRISQLLIAIGLLSACKSSSDEDSNKATPTTTVPGPGAAGTTSSDDHAAYGTEGGKPSHGTTGTPSHGTAGTPSGGTMGTPSGGTMGTPPGGTMAQPSEGTTTPTEGAEAKPTDAQILTMSMAVHEMEIDAAKIAMKKATGKEAKAFAQMMLDDHGKGLANGKALTDKLGMTLEDTAMVTTMKTEAKATADRLQATEGMAFDHAYLEAMAKGHQHVLQMLDDQMIPNATNPELKAYLEAWRPGVAKHLEHAQKGGMKHPPS